MLLEEIAEVMRLLVSHIECDVAHARVAPREQFLGRLQTNFVQLFHKCLAGFLGKDRGEMVGAKANLSRDHMQG